MKPLPRQGQTLPHWNPHQLPRQKLMLRIVKTEGLPRNMRKSKNSLGCDNLRTKQMPLRPISLATSSKLRPKMYECLIYRDNECGDLEKGKGQVIAGDDQQAGDKLSDRLRPATKSQISLFALDDGTRRHKACKKGQVCCKICLEIYLCLCCSLGDVCMDA
jgi:hypothetical protein